jgi:hypothetical protein
MPAHEQPQISQIPQTIDLRCLRHLRPSVAEQLA